MNRLALTAAGAALFAFAFGSVVSARGGATVDVIPVSFVLTSGACSNLPAGTTLVGSGTGKSVTTVTNRHGVITIENSSHAHGTAIDQAGNVYVFNYSNDSRGTVDESGVFSGDMNDAFSLAGSGPARLSNGFSGDVMAGPGFFSVPNVTRSHGDPIDFATGAAHCDPL